MCQIHEIADDETFFSTILGVVIFTNKGNYYKRSLNGGLLLDRVSFVWDLASLLQSLGGELVKFETTAYTKPINEY